MEIRLPKNETVRIEGDPRGLVLCCREGIVWLTQEGDDRDRFLKPGEMFGFTQGGAAVIEGYRDALVTIVRGAHPARRREPAHDPAGIEAGIRLVYHGADR
ncbi:DUF2917 domain-containing protein [Geobacter pickeringii]|uniref:DUF2917 domain-containing protein n=1 Tax=Geobacter pickeringii TaxID=345632 RepID=A0A0B5BDR7_9BACT|nr:DUF2917 domain-containing protein [Geobacter pickeringii]AJE02675.1 hypothetical protein GPICK_04200 [Geobacter pickeringii]